MIRTPLLLSAVLGALAGLPSADTIVGRVVDSNGVGVVGVDIDVESLSGGGNPTLSGDFTTAGGFFTTTLPTGVYSVSFKPPAPPTTTHLVTEVTNVVVVGSTNLGVIELPPGVALSGRAVRQSGLPVVGVDIDVIDDTGANLTVIGDTTDVLGEFSVAVPLGPIELRLDASSAPGAVLASRALELDLVGGLDIGDVVLPPGHVLSGTVRTVGGAPIINADIDVIDSASGDEIYTPGDNTNALGFFDVVVPSGTWDVELCPKFADQVVAATLPNVVVNQTVALGVAVLQPGVVLSGVVRSFDGTVLQGVDVDLLLPGTGQEVTLCGDDTKAGGSYAVVVPTGVFDVKFTPSYSLPFASQIHPNIVIASGTALDGTLSECPFWTNYGTGLAGTGGVVPHIETSGGAPRLGNTDFAFELQDGVGGSVAALIIGVGPSTLPLFGGTLLIDLLLPSKVFLRALQGPVGVAGAGSAAFGLPSGIDVSLVGLSVFSQFAVFDTAAPEDFAMSDALSVTFCE